MKQTCLQAFGVLVLAFTQLGAQAASVDAEIHDCNVPPAAAIAYVQVPGNPFQALPSEDGCWIFVSLMRMPAHGDVGIALLRRAAGTVSLVRVLPFTDSPRGMVLTHDRAVLIAAADSAVVFVDVPRLLAGDNNAIVGRLKEGEAFGRIYVNVTHDDRFLFVSDERAQSITVVNLAEARRTGFTASSVIGRIPVGIEPIALILSPNEQYLYTTSERAPERFHWPIVCKAEGSNPATVAPPSPEGAIFVVDVERAKVDPATSVISVTRAGCSPVRLVTSPNAEIAYVTARNSNALLAFDTRKLASDTAHALIASLPIGTAPVGVAVIDSGRRVVVANSNRFVGNGDAPESLAVVMTDRLSAGSKAIVGHIATGGFPRELRLTQGGRVLVVTNFYSRSVEVVDLARLSQRWDATASAAPSLAVTSPARRLHRVGILSTGANSDVTLARGAPRMEALRSALEQLGYREGENIEYQSRVLSAGGALDTVPIAAAARELVRDSVDIIVAGGSTEALMAKHATPATPIVFWSAEPVADGLVKRLEHPGGNATGIIRSPGTFAEQLSILQMIAGDARPIGFLYNASYAPGVGVLALMRHAADSLRLRLDVVEARDSAELDSAMSEFARRGVGSVIVGNHGLFRRESRRIVALSLRYNLRLLSPYPEARDAGALVASVPDFAFWSRRAAVYVDRILKGEQAGNLSVEQSVPMTYTVNLHTAGVLGISLPESVVRRAGVMIK